MASNTLAYELNVSPRTSIDSHDSIQKHHDRKPQPHLEQPPSTATNENDRPATTLTPSIRLLFSLLSRRHCLVLLLPAILSSFVAGGIAPFMTYVVGKAFDAFADHQISLSKQELLRGVGIASLELLALAVASLALGSLTSFLWIWTGELNVLALRKRVYEGVTSKEVVWFDLHMGTDDDSKDSIGAGGLMAKFSRETDDVRSATSLASGLLIQHLTTTLTSLLLAFHRSWSLTLVVLSAVPLLTILQSISQIFAAPLLAIERKEAGVAATIVDRAVAAISTVKAFNAQPLEVNRAKDSFNKLKHAAGKLNALWGLTSGSAQFVMMAMFVQGFWFGAKLVRDGKISPGDVMAVFWACLIATSNLQMCIPRWIVLAKGKFAMVELLSLVVDSNAQMPPQHQYPPSSPLSISHRRSHLRNLRKITPKRCMGELALHNVTFTYPSRPNTDPILSDLSLFLPAHELTFIVGSSGSGKSTVAQLLLGMYEAKHGQVTMDEQDIKFLEETWVRENVMGVGQAVGGGGCVVLEGRSVFENVAAVVAASERQVSREEVEEACRAALLHDFVRDLPEGYDTILGGSSGMQLSGGQRQRLAIARAKIRNPPVLILDEATSALDPTSRLLVFSALKRWRHKKTTVVITHDLSQIESDDFVYVLKSGVVVEQGFRYDLELEERGEGEFRRMVDVQKEVGGFVEETVEEEEVQVVEIEVEGEKEEEDLRTGLPSKLKHQSLAIRPLTFGNWMFEVIAELTGSSKQSASLAVPEPVHMSPSKRETYRTSRFVPFERFDTPPVPALPIQHQKKRRPSSLIIPSSPTAAVHAMPTSPGGGRRFSLPPMTASSATFTFVNRSTCMTDEEWERGEEEEFDKEKAAMTRSGALVHVKREKRRERRGLGIKVVENKDGEQEGSKESVTKTPSFWTISKSVWPTIPSKPLLLLGLVLCTVSGLVTPVFSFLLSRILFEVSVGATRVGIINRFGAIVLSVAAFDGIFLGSKYAVMESCGMRWVTKLRERAFKRVLSQDRSFFDRSDNSPPQIVQTIVKDGDDARNLVGIVWGQCFVVCTMLSVGLIWALVRGWQLTLAGFAIAPVFAGVMAIQTRLVADAELRNKRAREDVAKGYYDAVMHVRGIRCVGGAFEAAFRTKFELAAERALKTGVRGALVEGCTYGVASGLIYAAEALLFYVGAVLISKDLFTYLQMVEVLNLVVFTVTIGSQLMAFTEKIAKSVQATADLTKLSTLPSRTDESEGVLTPTLAGPIHFNNVQFAYPERPEIPVLTDFNLEITDGECVAIVGSSGSGKSTIASLLQRLYQPVLGSITIGYTDLRDMDVSHLRNGVSVVSQQPNLFDASIAENIRYGNTAITDVDVRTAAKAANVHQFIMELPHGYDTVVGENASLISGGQAQRIQIARALARPDARILILDECTSALDAENETAVMETIRSVKEGRTTVMVTHKVEVMRMCDRIVVVGDGVVQEQGTYEDLMERKGVFATLASGGEWVGA